jgi:hypothetical protein
MILDTADKVIQLIQTDVTYQRMDYNPGMRFCDHIEVGVFILLTIFSALLLSELSVK